MMNGNDTDHHKVPIWIGTDCKLVSGINKSTTCQHVIQSLVRTDNPSKFVIVEKWKKMERKLDPTVRILKVWKAWGDQKDDVALILRHHHSTDGYIDKKISNKVLRRNKSSSQHHKQLSSNHDENMEEVEVTEPMERLLKLVLTQGETIQAQLKKLRHQEEQIERYEEQMHRLRSLQEGENYVVESYLRDDKGKKIRKRDKSPRKSAGWLKSEQQQQQQQKCLPHHRHHHEDHKSHNSHQPSSREAKETSIPSAPDSHTRDLAMGTIVQSSRLETGGEDSRTEGDEVAEASATDIHEQNEMMERICDLNSKLTKEEEHLVKLGLKIKKFYERHKDCKDGMEENEEAQQQQREYLREQSQKEEQELRQLISQLEALRDVTNEQFSEIEMNEKSLNEMEQLLDAKHDHVAHLTYQLQLVDEESEQLRQRLLKISQGFPPPHPSSSLPPPPPPPPQQHLPLQHPHHQYPHYTPAISNSYYYPYTSQHHQQFPQEQQQQESFEHSIVPLPTSALPGVAPATAATTTGSNMTAESEIPISTSHHHHHPHNHGHAGEPLLDHLLNHPLHQPLVSSSSSNSDAAPPANINFGCQHSENISTTTSLNLHIKPCRDHQDNDSNSDTGISSLHSSSDENTLFVLDTLV